jgi:hypothetical protein
MDRLNRRTFVTTLVIGSAAAATLSMTRARADAPTVSCAQCAHFVGSGDDSAGSCGLNGGQQVPATGSCGQFEPRPAR